MARRAFSRISAQAAGCESVYPAVRLTPVFTSAHSASGTRSRSSLHAAVSPESMMTGTPKAPASKQRLPRRLHFPTHHLPRLLPARPLERNTLKPTIQNSLHTLHVSNHEDLFRPRGLGKSPNRGA